jgi:ADP-ribose pyrophosphatase
MPHARERENDCWPFAPALSAAGGSIRFYCIFVPACERVPVSRRKAGEPEVRAFEVTGDERVGEGGYLRLRRMRLRLLLSDGRKTPEGTWDYVERPVGLDAVVVAIFRRRSHTVEVLLRHGVRVPVQFGRPEKPEEILFPELVAGIVEPGDDLRERAAAEAMEEAGLHVDAFSVRTLGPASFPTPGMCAEIFHFVCCEVEANARASPVQGDGSPFEEGARLEWLPLEEALARCRRGAIRDMKTEIGLRRLAEHLRAAKRSR